MDDLYGNQSFAVTARNSWMNFFSLGFTYSYCPVHPLAVTAMKSVVPVSPLYLLIVKLLACFIAFLIPQSTSEFAYLSKLGAIVDLQPSQAFSVS